MTELTAPVVKRNDEKRIVYGPVLIPGEADHDGDIVSMDKIEQVAYDFAEKYGNIDLMHSLNNVGKMVETYLSPVDLTFGEVVVPKGSWMIGVRVTDEESWEEVKSGKLNGFSIMGIRSTVAKSKEETSAVKRTTLADLGEDWLVNAVSLVDEPAVPKAKFLVVKSKHEATDKDAGFFARLRQALSRSEEAAVKEEDEMTKEDVQLFIQSAVKTAIQEAIKSSSEKQEPSAAPLDELPVVDESKDNNEDANEQKDQVTLSKQEYESLLNRVNEIEGVVEKARGYGLFFRSNKLKGQDNDSVQQPQSNEQDQDIFGRRIQK